MRSPDQSLPTLKMIVLRTYVARPLTCNLSNEITMAYLIPIQKITPVIRRRPVSENLSRQSPWRNGRAFPGRAWRQPRKTRESLRASSPPPTRCNTETTSLRRNLQDCWPRGQHPKTPKRKATCQSPHTCSSSWARDDYKCTSNGKLRYKIEIENNVFKFWFMKIISTMLSYWETDATWTCPGDNNAKCPRQNTLGTPCSAQDSQQLQSGRRPRKTMLDKNCAHETLLLGHPIIFKVLKTLNIFENGKHFSVSYVG